jgi:hypothetical protein
MSGALHGKDHQVFSEVFCSSCFPPPKLGRSAYYSMRHSTKHLYIGSVIDGGECSVFRRLGQERFAGMTDRRSSAAFRSVSCVSW